MLTTLSLKLFYVLIFAPNFQFCAQPLDILQTQEYAFYASLSYCPRRIISSWKCRTCNKYTRLKLLYYTNDYFFGTAAFIGIDSLNKKLLVSYRGTSSPQNAWADLLTLTIDYPYKGKDCRVHSGFYIAYQASKKKMLKSISRLIQKEYEIVIVGHSLGGALAIFLALDLLELQYENAISLVTFGQPKLGNLGFSTLINNMTKLHKNVQITRISNSNDPVPNLPLKSQGFYRNSHEYKVYDSKQYIECDDTESPFEDANCIAGPSEWKPLDHINVLNVSFVMNCV